MNLFRYTIKSFLHFFKLNLTVILGVALSMAILLGAFIIGDSVKFSLQQITVSRLGNTEYVITAGERLFRSALSDEINEDGLRTSSLLLANGMAILNGGEARANKLQVWGVDDQFNSFAGTDSLFNIENGEAVINDHLAKILGIKKGQELLIRVNKLSTFPSNTPFVSADETSISFRVTIKDIAQIDQTGNFNLLNIQSSPKNIFISKEWLNDQLELANKANVILVNAQNTTDSELLEKISKHWQLDDLNLQIRHDQQLGFTELISDRVFFEPEIEGFVKSNFENSYSVFSYFVNEFKLGDKNTPYSFVSGVPNEIEPINENEITINQWLAEDLSAKTRDTINLNYFVVGPLRKLENESHQFVVKQIVPLEGKWADQLLMPEIPGLSDAGHCSDWETGVPVDLSSIRQKDEDYWNQYKGTPKAFVNIETAKKLWKNRFGASTALRFNSLDKQTIQQKLLNQLSPTAVGFQVTAAKSEGMNAASNGVDFGGLFIGLSFFVLFAALLLAYLMFKLYLNFRRQEIATLQAIGFNSSKIRIVFFNESTFIILTGIILGIPIGLAYNSLILNAIGTIWYDIVLTSILVAHVTFSAILKAIISILVIGLLTVWLILKKYTKSTSKSLREEESIGKKKASTSFIIGLALLVGSIGVLLGMSIKGGEVNPNIFFASGFGLLPALILLLNAYFIKRQSTNRSLRSYSQMIWQRIHFNRKKNIMLVSFLSVGIFLVLSTGLNRKDLTSNADQPSSGTGGYTFFTETSLPVLQDLNSSEGQFEFGLENSTWNFVQFRALSGDDASCLNLNRISRPKVLGFDPQPFDEKQSFTFITKTDELDEKHPWLSLNKKLPNGQIPAIADETVIKWGFGKTVGDTLVYKNESGENVTLKLIGGLANSIFQGNVLIADEYFLENFPSVSGSQILLAEGGSNDVETLQSAFRNYGIDITPTKERLLQFYQIENTYLNIFLQLGALGLLIGTIGLGIVIFRSLMEKRSEFALLKATGYTRRKLFKISFTEYLIVVILSICIGAIPAVISALPSLLSNLYQGLVYWTFIVAILVFASATVWILIAGKLAMKEPLSEALRND
ncbi:FtsX-like permease family protein [Sunxiuqinia sp. A32]|uniref:FtsX-like permease family protein n=1 Tax=Sunxiuqinia sp. A32 TaxID=3461496 RepID=UPI004045F53C